MPLNCVLGETGDILRGNLRAHVIGGAASFKVALIQVDLEQPSDKSYYRPLLNTYSLPYIY